MIGGGILFVIIITLVLFFSFFSEESKIRSAMKPIIEGTDVEITDIYINGTYACAGIKSKKRYVPSGESAGIALSKVYGNWFVLPSSVKDGKFMTFNSCTRIINQLK